MCERGTGVGAGSTVDMAAGIYLRTQNRGQQLLVSSVREEDEREVVDNPDNLLTVADDLFRAEKLHLLQHRLRGLDLGGTVRDYCGIYTLNKVDVHPVVGHVVSQVTPERRKSGERGASPRSPKRHQPRSG